MPFWPRGVACVCRCVLLDPSGFRPLTHDILLVPETTQAVDVPLMIGSDAEKTG